MNTKHTQEPWVDCPAKGNTERRIEHKGVGNNCISLAVLSGPDREANSARAVQCVNACAGIPDPAAALELAREAIRKIQRHIPNQDHAGCSLSADLDLCKQALAALNVEG